MSATHLKRRSLDSSDNDVISGAPPTQTAPRRLFSARRDEAQPLFSAPLFTQEVERLYSPPN